MVATTATIVVMVAALVITAGLVIYQQAQARRKAHADFDLSNLFRSAEQQMEAVVGKRKMTALSKWRL